MILKLMTAPYPNEVWHYIDNIKSVTHHGQIMEPQADGSDGNRAATPTALISGQMELRRHAERIWGSLDNWGDVQYPLFDQGFSPCSVDQLVLTRRDDSVVLVFANLSTYLMSDQGDTIEKIRS